jgi:hypothetical protein
MPRITKYDETVFTKPNYWGKILMYNSVNWDVLYPIVDIIRILPKDTVIANQYGKNQDMIRIYGSQYNHRVVGVELKKRESYIDGLKCVKFVFIFSDTQDNIADNLIKYCEKSKTPLICYSNLDNIYYFYEYNEINEKITHQFKEPQQVIDLLNNLIAKGLIHKFQDLFPEFEIIETPEIKTTSKLASSLKILKEKSEQKPKVYKIPFDANFNQLKRLEANKKTVVYDDELPVKKSNLTLSNFFKKK